ncbi:GNAT family N-acetyltransferase [Streptomyces sp. NRRL B-24484]|uniref:GNAT family N-acetyltransferase n=1 Tax=Streptomyces sp. NRRL B-24484 TaxID=1463833 RepID=UPI000AF59A7A|nr:GNAT family N-acetyltransferase [Streptomyces sp. NRRL B-24484]
MTAVPAPPVPSTPGGTVLRPITGPDEVELFNRLPYAFNHEIAGDLAAGRRRPELLWTALDADGRLLARAGWWCPPGSTEPLLLDVLDHVPGHRATAEALLRRALAAVVPEGTVPPKYTRFLPAGWREDPAVRAVVDGPLSVVERLGAVPFVERLRLEWRAGTPVPDPTGRLRIRPAAGEAEVVDLCTGILAGTLDAYSRDDLSRMTAREAAQQQYDEEFAQYTTPRAWWRVAESARTGEPVGLVVAARNAYRPIIAYLGVLPGHRGRGLAEELLAEGTRVLAAAGAEVIRASTDVGNTPMAAAFGRTGYTAFEHEYVMTWG